jgi:hypothetical protein
VDVAAEPTPYDVASYETEAEPTEYRQFDGRETRSGEPRVGYLTANAFVMRLRATKHSTSGGSPMMCVRTTSGSQRTRSPDPPETVGVWEDDAPLFVRPR